MLAAAAMRAAQNSPGAEASPGFQNMAPAEWTEVQTVMVRNLPNKYSQQLLIQELNGAGFAGTYDFFYLPIDTETNANKGYAFINFIDPAFAWMLRMTYEGQKMGQFNSEKVVSVVPAALQGFEANHSHYATARVNRGAQNTRPLFLREPATACAKPERRRGGRRSQGSAIDIAARHQARKKVGTEPMQSTATALTGYYIGTEGPGHAASKKGMPPPAQDKNPEVRFCPNCGGKATAGFRFCQYCGSSLQFLDLDNASCWGA